MNVSMRNSAGSTWNGNTLHYRNPDLDFSAWDNVQGGTRKCCCCWDSDNGEGGISDQEFCRLVRRCLGEGWWSGMTDAERTFCRRVHRCLCGEEFEVGSDDWRFCRRVRRCLCNREEGGEEGISDREFCRRVHRCLNCRNLGELSSQERAFCRRVHRCLCGEEFEVGSDDWYFCRRVQRCLRPRFNGDAVE